jgi:hypothetical protein
VPGSGGPGEQVPHVPGWPPSEQRLSKIFGRDASPAQALDVTAPLHVIPRGVDQKAPRMPAAESSFDICLRAWNIRVLTVPSGTPTICATSLTRFPW